jgi:hypothetical protein
MPTLNIDGRKVQVDDSFLKLPPDQQAATVDEIAASFAKSAAPAASPAAAPVAAPAAPATSAPAFGEEPDLSALSRQQPVTAG